MVPPAPPVPTALNVVFQNLFHGKFCFVTKQMCQLVYNGYQNFSFGFGVGDTQRLAIKFSIFHSVLKGHKTNFRQDNFVF